MPARRGSKFGRQLIRSRPDFLKQKNVWVDSCQMFTKALPNGSAKAIDIPCGDSQLKTPVGVLGNLGKLRCWVALSRLVELF